MAGWPAGHHFYKKAQRDVLVLRLMYFSVEKDQTLNQKLCALLDALKTGVEDGSCHLQHRLSRCGCAMQGWIALLCAPRTLVLV